MILLMKEASTLSDKLACSKASLSSFLFLIWVPHGRDVFALLQFLRDYAGATIFVADLKMIGCWDAAFFNFFVDFTSETFDCVSVHWVCGDWFSIGATHNREVATDIRRDDQLFTIISIKLTNLGIYKLASSDPIVVSFLTR
jgi:hypothetical protein